jgi:hypothetical protein
VPETGEGSAEIDLFPEHSDACRRDRRRPSRAWRSNREVTCFINDLGLGLQFAVVYRKAKEAGGTQRRDAVY